MNMKTFIKKNKYTIIAIVCFLILVLVLVQVKNIFFPNSGKAIYGERLNGIESVKINKEKLVSKLKENETITKASVVINGKIINAIVTVKDETSLEDAKNLTSILLDNLSKSEKKFYDVEMFIKKTNDDVQFPIIGYKHRSKEVFSFTKDRAGA